MAMQQDVERARAGEKNLRGSNLSGVDLSGVDLRGVDLTDAYLGHTILREADLRGANLRGANLSAARLQDSLNFDKTIRKDAIFSHQAQFPKAPDGLYFDSSYRNDPEMGRAFSDNSRYGNLPLFGRDSGNSDRPDFDDAVWLDAILDSATTLPDGSPWADESDLVELMNPFTDPGHRDFWRSDDPESPAYSGNIAD